MKYYKDDNNEIYGYEDGEKPLRAGLVAIDEAELNEILDAKIDEKARELAQLEAQIKETESYIRHAILIGNDSALPELREEYKELIAQKQALEKGDENEKEN
ncbi:V-type ATPase 116kDa subunit family protein [Campylobacter concisus]|uniref:hypothetical protein n=1 Tax=Campylobacter concisus TaxID=199 RepID=UPI00188456EF|nr:hypothetical protein [Campylobacter concisus]MBE9852599.1 V-type ATPase 116kDa subunit family protein [Campylobacter concisus]